MSNESFAYKSIYSSGSSHQRVPQSVQPEGYQAHSISSSTPYYRSQVAASASNYAAADYQSDRYPQYQQSSGGAHFSWYGASASDDGVRQERETGERDNMKAGQQVNNSRLINQLPYNASVTGSYAYGSASNFSSHQGVLHEERMGFPNRGVSDSGRSNEDINVRIPYQPYSRSFKQSNIIFESSQQERGHNEARGTTKHALGAQSYKSRSQPSRNPTIAAGSYSSYASNIAVPRSNVASTDKSLGNGESQVRQKTQDNFPQRYVMENQLLRTQAFQDQQNQVVRPRPQAAESRKLQNNARTIQRQSAKTPPSSHAHPSRISNLHQNATKPKEPRRNQSVSTSKNLHDNTQPAHQLASGHIFNNVKTSEEQSANPSVSGYPATQSIFRSETIKDKSSTISEGPEVDLRPRSPNVHTTVDPSQVYNQYHEYQRQIEAADAEHARLEALKLERVAAEAAAAAIASAKALSRTMDSARLQLENERLRQVHGNTEGPNYPASNAPTLSNLNPAGQASTRGFTEMPQAGPVLLRELPTVDPQKVAAMEEEMRLMVEKIREYRTQDPQLFAHVWESVKSKRAPVPAEAQIPVGEDPLKTSIESHIIQQRTNPASSTAQDISQPVAISHSVKGPGTPANPVRKRNGRLNAADSEKAVDGSQKPIAQARKRANLVTDTSPNEIRNSVPKRQEMQREPQHTYHKSPETLGTSIKPSATSNIEHMDAPDSVHHSLTSNGLLNQVPTASQGIPKINQSTTKDLNHIDPAILRQSAQRAQSAIETRSKNTSTEQPTGRDVTQNSLPTYDEKKSGVIWPDEQRNTIANTAARTLNALPENAGREIAAFQILDMLGYDPSYIELCKLIESIGFKFDRARFAKTLLAAISGVNSGPAQSVEPEILQSPISPSTTRENNKVTSEPDNVAHSSCNAEKNLVTHEQTQTLSGDGVTLLANRRSQAEVNKVKLMLGGRGSRGPYRKTIERMVAMQNNPSSSEGQRGREIKYPRMTPVSDDYLDRSYPAGRTPFEKQNSIDSGASRATTQAPLVATGSYKSGSIEERLLVALKGGVPDKTNVLASGHNHAVTKPTGLPTTTSILQTQSTPLAGQSTTGWRGHTVSSPPPGAVDKDANSQPTTKVNPTIAPTFTKEMAARKRTFTEIIDLTSSDTPTPMEDNAQTSRKARRVGGTNFGRELYYDAAQEPKPLNNSSKHGQSGLTATTSTPSLMSLPKIPQSEVVNQANLITTPLLPNPYKGFSNIVKPIDKAVALRKSRYDPKTIARDILITIAQHPFQRGLNAHLEPLIARFAKVDGSSDLSTFRWDIVDPGGPPVDSANMSSILEEGWKGTPSSIDGEPSSRKNLDGIELPVHQGPLRPTRGGASIRGRARKSLMGTQARQPVQPSGLRYSSTADSEIAVVIESTAAQASRDAVPTARRRGRPPSNFAVASQLNTPLRKRIGRPPKHLSRGINIQGKSSGRQVGRARTHTVSKSKPTGRPRKSGSKLATPKFVPFLCEWKDCKAELHNLETLKRHVYSVHNQVLVSGAIACQWAKCGLIRQVNDESKPISTAKSTPEPRFVHEYHEFGDMQLFKNHMEKAHLTPFAWYMGDGPRGSTLDGSESDVFAYQDDDDQIEPSIALQGDEEDGGEGSWTSRSRRILDRPYDPALESPVELATPEMKANFTMGTEWKTIKAPPRDEWLRFNYS